ncbi:MAG: FecR domain-containing protein, partial [Caulobacteraceae bacterium]
CSFARARAETAVGERRSVMLADGTHVELNTDTALAWRLKRDVRQLWLERGEAALSVAADRGRPFLLSANHTDTRLWPGQFDARLRGDSLDLAILSGRAQLQPRRALFTTAIGRSQAGTAAGGSGPSGLLITDTGVVDRGLSDIDLRAAVSWRRGEIVFDGEPLAGAVEEYNRYLTRKLVIGDRRLAGLRLDGRFPTSNPDGFLTVLNQAFGVRSIGAGLDQIVLIAAK